VLSHPARDVARLVAGPCRIGLADAGLSDTHCSRSRARKSRIEIRTALSPLQLRATISKSVRQNERSMTGELRLIRPIMA
jgi:hypothetical protein